MPKLERLTWLKPLSAGEGVTLTNDPAANLFLAEDPFGLLLGVLFDSQFPTRQAFVAPLRLRDRLGHLDVARIAGEDPAVLQAACAQKPALHRFPNKYAGLTQKLAQTILADYGGETARIWTEAGGVEDLSARLLRLPAFGTEKANWTVGMLGTLGMLPYGGWEEFSVTAASPT